MDPALAAVVPAAITATGTVLAALIRTRRPVPNRSQPDAADGPPSDSGGGHLDEHQAEIQADGMPSQELHRGGGR